MPQRRLPFFEEHTEPLDQRVAVGLQKIGLALKHSTWKQAAEDGLSPTQGQVLGLLAGEPMTGSAVAAGIGVSLPTVSESVRVLVEKGLVAKEPDPRHPRASLLRLTAAGRKRVPKVNAWPEFLASAVGAMSPREQSAFLTGLMKMIRALQEAGHIPVQRMCISCNYFRPNVHEGEAPHHCAFVDSPMKSDQLRLDCAEQTPAEAGLEAENFRRFVNAG